MTQLSEVVGIGDIYAAKLLDAGIETLRQFLEAGSTPQDRLVLAEKTGISRRRILRWVKRVDPFKAIDIGGKSFSLLKAAGVNSVPKLTSFDPLDLFELLVEVNKGKKYVKKVPPPRKVENWIKAGEELPKIIA